MVFNSTGLIIPVFPGINDEPLSATDTTAGNGSELISKHNTLVNRLVNTFNGMNASTWQVFTGDNRSITDGDKLLINTNLSVASTVIIQYSTSNLEPGRSSFSLFSQHAGVTIEIIGVGAFDSQGVEKIHFDTNRTIFDFIYVGDTIGWTSTNPNLIGVVQQVI